MTLEGSGERMVPVLPAYPQDQGPLPTEIERILNPAYCACVLARYAVGYREAQPQGGGVPFPLLFLCLPLALYAPARTSIISHSQRFGLHRFLHEHPEVLVQLPAQVEGLRSTTRVALLFGTTHGALALDVGSGTIQGNTGVARRLTTATLGEAAMVPVRAADRLGTWFGELSPAEIFLRLGMRP